MTSEYAPRWGMERARIVLDRGASSTGSRPGGFGVSSRSPRGSERGDAGHDRQGSWIVTGSLVPAASAAAMSRMSCVIFIEQYFGPHMLQKWALLNVSCGSVWS